MLLRLIQSEWIKIRKSAIWIALLASPTLSVGLGYLTMTHGKPNHEHHMDPWTTMYFDMASIYAIFLLPLLAGVLVTLLCRFEHSSGGWKQLFTLPVTRSTLYLTKLLFAIAFVGTAQVLLLLGVLLAGLILHFHTPVSWGVLLKSLLGGWIATMPLTALQLWVASAWKSFGTPFALNVILTIPAIAVARSDTYGPLYPWTQPMLAMLPADHGVINVTPETTMTIVISGIVMIVGGWIYFLKRDVHA